MRRSVIGILLLTMWLSGIHTPGHASCAAPTLAIEGREATAPLRPGEQVTASGTFWLDECDDTGDGGGCGGSEREPAPFRNIQLAIRGPVTKATTRHYQQEGYVGVARRNLVIGSESADEEGRLSYTFEVPNLPPGRYYLDTTPIGSPAIIEIEGPAEEEP